MSFSFNLDIWTILQLLILPVVLPMVVGIVSTRVTSPRAKALLLLALSVVGTFITQLLNAYNNGDVSFNFGMAVLGSLITFLMGVGIHFGLLKPTGTTDVLLDNGRTAEGYGEIN